MKRRASIYVVLLIILILVVAFSAAAAASGQSPGNTTQNTPPLGTIEVRTGITEVTYDGKSHGIDLDIQTAAVTVKYRTTDSGNYTLTTAPVFTKAGVYTVWYQITKKDFATAEGTATVQINPKPLTVDIVVKDKKYDGLSNAAFQKEPALSGVLEGDTVTLVQGKPAFSSIYIGDEIPINLTKFSISGADAENYTLSQPTGMTANILPGFTPQEDVHYTVTERNDKDWLNTDFILTARDGYLLNLTDMPGGDWQKSIRYGEEAAGGSAAFYVKNTATGEISIAVAESYQIDKTKPIGEISAGSSGWARFLNTITLGRLFQDTDKLQIKAKDTMSGVAAVYHYKAETALGPKTDWEKLDWAEGGSIAVASGAAEVVYAKIIDKAGNVAVINSDGETVYSSTEENLQAVTYMRFGTNDVIVAAAPDKAVAGINDGKKDLTVNSDYMAAGNLIFLKPAYLDTLSTGDHVLTVSQDALGSAEMDAEGDWADTAAKFVVSVQKAGPLVSLTAVPTKNVNEVTVTAAVSGVEGHMPTGSVTFFNGAASLGSIALNGGRAEITVVLAPGGNDLKAVYGGDGDYSEAVGAIPGYDIARTSQRPLAITGLSTNYTYDDEKAKITLGSSGGSGSGSVTYVSSDTSVAKIEGNELTLLKAGQFTVVAKKAGDEKYNERSVASAVITVKKAQPVIVEKPVSPVIWAGGTLPAVSGGKADVPGSFVWTQAAPTVTGSGNYGITFAPEDQEAYAYASLNLTVNAVDKSKLETLIAEEDAGRKKAVVGDGSGEYPQAAVDLFASAIASAQGIANSPPTVQADVDGAAEALSAAATEFAANRVTVDFSALDTVIATAQTIEKGNENEVRWEAMQKALTAAESLRKTAAASQAEVDKAQASLAAAVSGLRETAAGAYEVLGNFGTFAGQGDRTATIDAGRPQFETLTLQDEEVAAADYAIAGSGTVITLREKYLASLPQGSYVFRAQFADGYADLTLTVQKNALLPEDAAKNSRLIGFIAVGIAVLMLFTFGLWLFKRRKRKKYRW